MGPFHTSNSTAFFSYCIHSSTEGSESRSSYCHSHSCHSRSLRSAAIVAIAAAQKDQNPDPVIAAATSISIIICQSITSAVIAAACCS